jgi:DnaJ-class molecular chaperone
MRTVYDILGISGSASGEDIKKAYRARAKTVHPDRNDDPHAHEEFLLIKAAYEILIDPLRRAAYDANPEGTLQRQIADERMAQRLRRRRRLKRLYD